MEDTKETNEVCVVCCRETIIYAVGPCDHHVCYECSSRMRVLCQQNECPICRSDMPLVAFSKEKKSFSEFYEFQAADKKYKIAFENEEILDAFDKLLEHRCPKCKLVFDKFAALDKHVRREHGLQYCSVCVDNLKLFSFERRCYDRKDLAFHNRKGDIDDKSHKGHPMCESCQVRYIDHDELYRHLRKEHFFCHFCDADGQNLFFEDYDFLQNHFRKEHYLCEEGDCVKERFIGAFRSEIDLKAHIAKVHCKNKSKAEVKQTRTLDLEFNYASWQRQTGEYSPNSNRRGRNMNGFRRRNIDDDVRNVPTSNENAAEKTRPFNAVIHDFPTLSNNKNGISAECKVPNNSYSSCISAAAPNFASVSKQRGQKKFSDEFPALSTNAPNSNSSAPSKGQTFSQHIQKAIGSPKSKVNAQKWTQKKKPINMSDFPQLDSNISSEPESVKPWRKTSEEILAQQIAMKCKEKSKNEQQVLNSVSKHEKPSKPPVEEPVPMALAYGGLSKHNPSDNPKKKFSEMSAEIEMRNQISEFHKRDPYEDTPWYEPVKLSLNDDGDFPPLESNSFKAPPGFENPLPSQLSSPPGFSRNSRYQPSTNANISLSSIAQQLTKNPPVPKPSKSEPPFTPTLYSYQQPKDFQERNDILYSKLTELIGSNNKLLNEFKLLSGNFRRSKVSASEYHANCLKILGKDEFLQLFSELLCLLPDIQKQQELLMIHEEFLKDESRVRGAVPKTNRTFGTCSFCLQVVNKRDLTNHQLSHKNKTNGYTS